MGNHNASKFQDSEVWVILTKNSNKHLLQDKNTKEIVQKHILDVYQQEEISRESLIYQWRGLKKSAKYTAEILQMRYKTIEDTQHCGFGLCRGTQDKMQLHVYTQQIYKLYQNSQKIQLKDYDQYNIFYDLVNFIEYLSQKFGYFAITKEMVGYNQKKYGKAWINENFANNYTQIKRNVKTSDELQKWQREIVESLIDICELTTTQSNSKFNLAIQEVKLNRLFNFALFKQYFKEKLAGIKQNQRSKQSNSIENGFRSEMKHSTESVAMEQSIFSNASNMKQSNLQVNSSTQQIRVKRIENGESNISKNGKKYVMIPVVSVRKIYPVTDQQRDIIQTHLRLTNHSNKQQSKQAYVEMPSQTHSLNYDQRNQSYSQFRPNSNYVQVKRQTQSFISNSPQNRNEINNLNLFTICEDSENPLNITDRNDHRRRRKQHSKQEDRMLKEEGIQMIDSMIMIGNQDSLSEEAKRSRIVLEQSVILRGL